MARSDFKNHKAYHIPSELTGTLVAPLCGTHHCHNLKAEPERTVVLKRRVFFVVVVIAVIMRQVKNVFPINVKFQYLHIY